MGIGTVFAALSVSLEENFFIKFCYGVFSEYIASS